MVPITLYSLWLHTVNTIPNLKLNTSDLRQSVDMSDVMVMEGIVMSSYIMTSSNLPSFLNISGHITFPMANISAAIIHINSNENKNEIKTYKNSISQFLTEYGTNDFTMFKSKRTRSNCSISNTCLEITVPVNWIQVVRLKIRYIEYSIICSYLLCLFPY